MEPYLNWFLDFLEMWLSIFCNYFFNFLYFYSPYYRVEVPSLLNYNHSPGMMGFVRDCKLQWGFGHFENLILFPLFEQL